MSTEELTIGDEHAGYAWDLENTEQLYGEAGEIPQAFHSFARPEKVDPRPWHKIENQGPMGSCQGHSISSCVEALYYVATGGETIQLSRGYAYLATQKIDGLLGRDRGSTISGGVKVAQAGIPTEEAFPYPNPVSYSLLHRKFPPNQEVLRDAGQYAIKSTVRIRSHQDAVEWIGGGGAINIGIRWPVNLSNGARVTSFTGRGRGGHAIAILGYLPNGDLIVANSHSTRYGQAGWFFFTPRAFGQMLSSSYTACIGVSDMPAAEPRKVDWIEESPYV